MEAFSWSQSAAVLLDATTAYTFEICQTSAKSVGYLCLCYVPFLHPG